MLILNENDKLVFPKGLRRTCNGKWITLIALLGVRPNDNQYLVQVQQIYGYVEVSTFRLPAYSQQRDY